MLGKLYIGLFLGVFILIGVQDLSGSRKYKENVCKPMGIGGTGIYGYNHKYDMMSRVKDKVLGAIETVTDSTDIKEYRCKHPVDTPYFRT